MLVRAALEDRAVGVGERLLEPGVEVAAVGERAALDDAALVEPVEEEARPRLRPLGLVEDPQRARGADHQRRARRAGAAGAEVRAGAVDRAPGTSRRSARREARQPLLVDTEHVEQLDVPASCRRGRAGRCRTRSRGSSSARCRAAARRGSRQNETKRAADAEDLGLGLREPGELRRPEATGGGARRCARARRPGRAGAAATRRRRRCACRASRGARVSGLPASSSARSEWPKHEVPTASASSSRPSITVRTSVDDLVGVAAVVFLLLQLVDRLRALVEALGPDRGGADVEREHGRHAANLPLEAQWQS